MNGQYAPSSMIPKIVCVVLLWACVPPSGPTPSEAWSQVQVSDQGMVVAAQPLAAEAGAEMLRLGGNAADAAVAAAFAVSVVEPTMNSIGGRTQILVRLPSGRFAGIDATTQAPSTYDPATAPQAGYGYPTVGVPGALAGLVRLLEEHGTLPLATVMEPAIRLAREGFEVLPGEAARQAAAADQIREFPGSRSHFLKEDGSPIQAGDIFVQEDLAETLDVIAREGRQAFYTGSIAQRMVDDVEAHGGALTMEALASYRAEDARIVRGSYRGFELVGTDIPSSGAVSIAVLHILENFDMGAFAEDQWASVMGQALTKGFEHRGMLGTPEAAALMTDKAWAKERAAEIIVPEAVSSAAVPAPVADVAFRIAAAEVAPPDWDGATWGRSSTHTTHLSTGDPSGMYVSLTQTIGPNMGSKVVSPDLGFLYAATLGGYLGRVEPGERARSSISPLIVSEAGEPRLVLGAAGGARIISAVVQSVARVVDQGLSLEDALAAPRVHPIEGGVAMELTPGIGWDQSHAAAVRAGGFTVDEVARTGAFGRVHGLEVTPQGIRGVADPDWEGAAVPPRSGSRDEASSRNQEES